MKNKVLFPILILFGLLFFTSCSKQIQVGFLMDDSQTGRWKKDKALFIEHVESLGGKVLFRASEGNAGGQLEMAKELLKEGIDILVLVPTDKHEAAEIVLEAHRNNIRVISYDRMVRNCHVDFYISFDHVNVGELQVQYITTACPSGKYAILGGPKTDDNAMLLRLGQLSVLQPFVDKGDIEIVYDNLAEVWKPVEGYKMMEECLRKHRDIDAVIAANDKLAGGAVEAIKNGNIDKKVYIAGMDADLEACQRVFAGTQTMTIYKPIEAIATKAAEIAMEVAENNKIPSVNLSVNNGTKQVPALLLPAMVVNKNTLDLTVIADGYLEEHNIKQERKKGSRKQSVKREKANKQ